MKTVYLCGGINNLSDKECKDWREYSKDKLSARYNLLDPMRRDYRGKELENLHELVHGDLEDIRVSNYLLVMANKPSWGTAMEMYRAYHSDKLVITICDSDRPSPWLAYHSHHVFKNIDDAISYLLKIAK